jgi:hypothetical protein
MGYGYVYAPKSGSITGLDTYCSSGTEHLRVFAYNRYPVDIAGPGNEVRFYCSSSIRSIRVWLCTPSLGCHVCGSSAQQGKPWDQGVTVDLYGLPDASSCYMGSLFYGHLYPISVSHGQTINDPRGRVLGFLPPDDDPSPSCYDGAHVHLECNGNGTRNNLACWQAVYAGVTWIYRFAVPSGCPE